jgi:glycosyltransferase involved in cell wall biosynthesis
VTPGQVSVVACVRDGADYLAEALASAVAERPLELVVADDGSTDDSAAIAEAAGARVLRLDAVGPTRARNAALAAAEGELVACIDHDDRWPTGRLALMCDALGDADGVFGSQRLFGDGVQPQVLVGRHIGTLLLRRSALETVGLLDETLTGSGTVEWVARLSETLDLRTVDDVVLERRVHGKNFSLSADFGQDYVRAARAALLRRRGG